MMQPPGATVCDVGAQKVSDAERGGGSQTSSNLRAGMEKKRLNQRGGQLDLHSDRGGEARASRVESKGK